MVVVEIADRYATAVVKVEVFNDIKILVFTEVILKINVGVRNRYLREGGGKQLIAFAA